MASNAIHSMESIVHEDQAVGYTQLDTQAFGPLCPKLSRLVGHWANLPEHVRKAIQTLVGAHIA